MNHYKNEKGLQYFDVRTERQEYARHNYIPYDYRRLNKRYGGMI